MPGDIAKEIDALQQMTTSELAERYEELYGQPVRTRHRAYLIRKVAWRIQANAEGDLTERARQRAAEIADDGADLHAPMHCVPLASGIADVVTSFDALEHLLPEDVDPVLAEMRRVGRPCGHFVLSISTRPSRITVDGENLHPTVRPIDWWIDRIARVGAVHSVGTSGRYLTGVWHA